ncbi:MAG: lipase family protein [Gordonia sp. (in: high G+C Gram-positive bacteria)]|uniref:lipase family protein n=1 Tax=Gordonia sp. (in: high G+C Gram-positive bacteria) TaxID=84139 RepID=UPI0039E362D3
MRLLSLSLPLAVAASSLLVGAPSASAATGTVLSQSPVPAAQLPTGAARAVKVLYATRDQRGRPAKSTGVVYFPRGAAPAGGWRVVSWAHGTSGIAPKCAPSAFPKSHIDKFEPNVAGALRDGYVVTASDYIGMGGGGTTEYLGGRSAAYNVIDMVRAARHVDPTIGRRWASLGHSQGGHAALWAARVAPRYAPELPMVGAVAMAPASQVPTTMTALQRPGLPNLGPGNAMTAFSMYALSGLDHVYPSLRVKQYLSPLGRRWLARAADLCVTDAVTALKSVPPGSLYIRSTADSPRFMAALREYSGIPASGFRRPVRLQQGLADPIVPAAATATLLDQLRAGGAAVSAGWYPGDHHAVTRESLADTMAIVDGYFRPRR